MFVEEYAESQLFTTIVVNNDHIVVKKILENPYDRYEYADGHIKYIDIVGMKKYKKDFVIHYFKKQHDGSVQFDNVWIDHIEESKNERDYNAIMTKINKTSYNYLFLINPVSGSGNGKAVFIDQVLPIFDKSFHKFQIEYTTSKESIEQIVKIYNDTVDPFRAIVVIGGDGTVFDVVQAIKQFDMNVPIAVVPLGSGNGLAKSIMGKTSYTPTAIDHVYKILHGDKHKLDVSFCKGGLLDDSMYSILGQAWGMPSNVDIKSEYLRWMGNFRFTIQTIVELYNMNTYNGTLRYLSHSDETNQLITQARKSGLNCDDLSQWKSITGQFIMVWACQAPYMSNSTLVAPKAKLDDGKIHLVIIKSEVKKLISRYDLLKLFLDLEHGKHVDSDLVEIIPVLGYDLTIKENESSNITVDGELLDYTKLSVRMDDPIDIIY